MDWDTVVTLFIYGIVPTLPDTFIRRILDQCGKVIQWRRVIGVKNDPTDYGFVEFGSPNDALRALRIIPQIRILDTQWQVKIDKGKIDDLESFEQASKMRIGFDMKKELKQDQLIVQMVNEIVASSAFAKNVPRLTELLFSENDDDRVGEHYRYMNDIHRENDACEEIFRNDLIKWKKIEVNYQKEVDEMKKCTEKSKEQEEREEFLKNWEMNNDMDDEKNIKNWKLFLDYRKERKLLRTREIELEKLLS